MRGTWRTMADKQKSTASCTELCDRHYEKCKDKCQCAVQTNEVRNSNESMCKCVRDKSENDLLESCVGNCTNAREICINVCVDNPEPCPIKALTEVSWSVEERGTCDGICLKRLKQQAIGGARPPTCSAST